MNALRAQENARVFVDEFGSELDRARARALAARAEIDDVLESLARWQRADGSFAAPEDPKGRAGLGATLLVLGILDDLRALGAPVLELACVFLESSQRADGSWVGRDREPIDDRLFTTGMLAGHLAKTRWARPHVLASAGDYLGRHWSPDRVQGWNWRGIAAHAHFFANAPHDSGDEVLQWCGRELERGFRAGRWSGVQTARVLVFCDAHAMPGARIDARELQDVILSEQGRDGGWFDGADPSSSARVARTLDAMTALAHFGGERGRP